ncbi:MAG: AAA family ATPase [Gemmatimonadota bacterium]|nr:AAA family ATPase [Gemmatimonadota bacterium]
MALIAIGGFPGAGKTTICRRLCNEFNLPCLSSDSIGRTIERSQGIGEGRIESYRVAYDVLFRLCEDFIQSSVTVVLDLTLGWDFQWRKLDGILERHPRTLFLPVVLRCSHELCMERLEARHRANPGVYASPDYFRNEQKVRNIWQYLRELDRPEAHYVDASDDEDQVYNQVKQYVTGKIEDRE